MPVSPVPSSHSSSLTHTHSSSPTHSPACCRRAPQPLPRVSAVVKVHHRAYLCVHSVPCTCTPAPPRRAHWGRPDPAAVQCQPARGDAQLSAGAGWQRRWGPCHRQPPGVDQRAPAAHGHARGQWHGLHLRGGQWPPCPRQHNPLRHAATRQRRIRVRAAPGVLGGLLVRFLVLTCTHHCGPSE